MVINNGDLAELLQEKLRLLEHKAELKDSLPHLYGYKLYEWQRDYKNNKTNKQRFLCAANQIGKSTIQILDRIDVATNPSIWPQLWPHMFKQNKHTKPYSWYLYPSSDIVMAEFLEKWIPNYLPKGRYKDDPVYGWKEKIKDRVLKRIDFNSGWTIYFKTYSQDVHDLQAGTVFAIDTDEELPDALYSELQARLLATDGYFSMAFTATRGQDIWYKTMEVTGDDELFKDAWKRQISTYDCLEYEDGSQGPWTVERIKRAEAFCKSPNEIKRRIYGRFVKDSGLKYQSFRREVNYVPYPQDANGKQFTGAPKSWQIWSAVDLGSGGATGHPASVLFASISPDYKKIRVFRCKRYDKIDTTAGDVYNFYRELRGTLKVDRQFYDSASKDFYNIAIRNGDHFEKAEKGHDKGEEALGTALKYGMLKIYQSSEADKLVTELETLDHETNKRHAKDDLIDPLRYIVVALPIDWSAIVPEEIDDPVDLLDETEGMYKSSKGEWLREREEEDDETIDFGADEEFKEWTDLHR